MEICGKQVVYTKEKKKIYFLNPYTKIFDTDDGIFVSRTDSEMALFLEGFDVDLLSIFQDLKNGIDQGTLAKRMQSFMSEDSIGDWIDLMIQEGVIE